MINQSNPDLSPGIALRMLMLACLLLLLTAQTAWGDTDSEWVTAAVEGETDTLEALISDGSGIESDGGPALVAAAFSALQRYEKGEAVDGQVAAVQMLAKAGADADAHSENGITALMLMSILGQTGAVRVLLEAGADVNAVNNADGGTPLIFAVYGGSTETVSVLLDAGADLDATDAGSGKGDGQTALDYAREKQHAEITEVLEQAAAK